MTLSELEPLRLASQVLIVSLVPAVTKGPVKGVQRFGTHGVTPQLIAKVFHLFFSFIMYIYVSNFFKKKVESLASVQDRDFLLNGT